MPAKLDRCVKAVKRQSPKVRNAWAVCVAALRKVKKRK